MGKKTGRLKVNKPKEYANFEHKAWYKGKLESYEIKEGKFGDYIVLTFKILNGELENGESAKGQRCQAMMQCELNPKTKLFKFVKVLSGNNELDVDDEVDLDALIGKKASVFIEDSKNKREDGRAYQKITDIKAIKKKK